MKRLTLLAFLLLIGGGSAVNAQSSGNAQSGSLIAAASACNTPAASVTPNCVLLVLPANTGTANVSLGGTFSATVQFEGAGADGVFHALAMTDKTSTSGTEVTSATGAGYWSASVSALSQIRVRVSSYSSGTVIATINPSQIASTPGGSSSGGSFTAAGDLSGSSSSQTVIGINNTLLSGLASGLLYNTTSTGVPSIATSAQILATCTTCVVASSPGAGIAHFAGSTQTVTSSAVTSADATGNTSGSGNFCLTNSCLMTNSILGTPTSGTLTNATGYLWNNLAAPTGSLGPLAMGSNSSIFTTTSAVSQFFAWKNTTAAVVGTSQASPLNSLCGTAFHGSASVEDCLTLQDTPGNGNDAAITFAIGHSGTSTGAVTTTFPGPMQAGAGAGPGTLNLPGLGTGTCGVVANAIGICGPASASFTNYDIQFPSTAPSGTQYLGCGTPSSNVSTCTWATVSGASSLDQLTGAAAQATGTETGAGHNYTFAGVETTALVSPFVFQDTNSSNSNTSVPLISSCAGTSIGCIGFISNTVSGTAAGGGDVYRGYAGSTVSNGTLTGGTLEVELLANGEGLFGASAPNPTVGTGGGFDATEGSNATAAANQDICDANSTDHTILCSVNNGTFYGLQINQITTQTGTYAASVNDSAILCNAPSVAFTVTLPITGIAPGKVYRVKNINAAACTLSPSGGATDIDGALTYVLTTKYAAIDVVWDGTQYWAF